MLALSLQGSKSNYRPAHQMLHIKCCAKNPSCPPTHDDHFTTCKAWPLYARVGIMPGGPRVRLLPLRQPLQTGKHSWVDTALHRRADIKHCQHRLRGLPCTDSAVMAPAAHLPGRSGIK